MRRYGRRDKNEPELIMLAESLGAWIIKTDYPTDWLCWFRNWDVVEIKRADKEGWKSEYTPSQLTFRAEAARRGARLLTWRTRDDVLDHMGARVTA
jgi:hypothetical protein